MCSAAWRFADGGYELGFNRDEKWNRAASLDPQWETQHPVPGACARDAAAGGTWLFTNERGITLAVLNAYPGGRIPEPGNRSRGMIPLLAAAHATAEDIHEALLATPWRDFAPCRVLMGAPSGARHYLWDGIRFSVVPSPAEDFLTTSSHRCDEVSAIRSARYREIANRSIADILDDDIAQDPAAAIHATRADGGTVSRTEVIVDAQGIRFAVKRRGESFQRISSTHVP